MQTDYDVEHWTSACSAIGSTKDQAVEIKVNNRAATRQAIINLVQVRGLNFVTRSDWVAHKNRSERMIDDWNYSKIAIHHAGRSFSCGPAALQLQEIQEMQMGKRAAAMDDIGYHYALDCFGNVFEGRDIRFKGESVHNYNTGVIGIVLLENLSAPYEGNDGVAAIRTLLDRVGFIQRPKIVERQQRALRTLIDILREFFFIETLGGHREFPGQLGEGKICPANVGLALVQELRRATGLNAP